MTVSMGPIDLWEPCFRTLTCTWPWCTGLVVRDYGGQVLPLALPTVAFGWGAGAFADPAVPCTLFAPYLCIVFSAVQAPLASVVRDFACAGNWPRFCAAHRGRQFACRCRCPCLGLVLFGRSLHEHICAPPQARRCHTRPGSLLLSWSDLAPALQTAGGLWPLLWCWFLLLVGHGVLVG